MMSDIVGINIDNKVVKRVISQATVLHCGWDLDNDAWSVEFDDGTKGIIFTNHGGFYISTPQEINEYIKETQESVEQLKQLLKDIGEQL